MRGEGAQGTDYLVMDGNYTYSGEDYVVYTDIEL